MFDFVKFSEKAGGYLITLSQIVFGAVVVKGIFGDGSGANVLFLAIGVMVLLAAIGLALCSIAKKVNKEVL